MDSNLDDEKQEKRKIKPLKFMFNRPYNMQKLIIKNRKLEQKHLEEIGFKIAPNANSYRGFGKPGVRRSWAPHSTKNSTYKLQNSTSVLTDPATVSVTG